MAGGIRPDADHQAKRAYLGDEARLCRLVPAAVGNIDSSGEDLDFQLNYMPFKLAQAAAQRKIDLHHAGAHEAGFGKHPG